VIDRFPDQQRTGASRNDSVAYIETALAFDLLCENLTASSAWLGVQRWVPPTTLSINILHSAANLWSIPFRVPRIAPMRFNFR
jgi:hypothetical protein